MKSYDEFGPWWPKGTKVVYTRENAGYDSDQKKCKKHLKLGETYTVLDSATRSWSSEVCFEEVRGVIFNTVHFEKKTDA